MILSKAESRVSLIGYRENSSSSHSSSFGQQQGAAHHRTIGTETNLNICLPKSELKDQQQGPDSLRSLSLLSIGSYSNFSLEHKITESLCDSEESKLDNQNRLEASRLTIEYESVPQLRHKLSLAQSCLDISKFSKHNNNSQSNWTSSSSISNPYPFKRGHNIGLTKTLSSSSISLRSANSSKSSLTGSSLGQSASSSSNRILTPPKYQSKNNNQVPWSSLNSSPFSSPISTASSASNITTSNKIVAGKHYLQHRSNLEQGQRDLNQTKGRLIVGSQCHNLKAKSQSYESLTTASLGGAIDLNCDSRYTESYQESIKHRGSNRQARHLGFSFNSQPRGFLGGKHDQLEPKRPKRQYPNSHFKRQIANSWKEIISGAQIVKNLLILNDLKASPESKKYEFNSEPVSTATSPLKFISQSKASLSFSNLSTTVSSQESTSSEDSAYWPSDSTEILSRITTHPMFGTCVYVHNLATDQIALARQISKRCPALSSPKQEKKYWSKCAQERPQFFQALYGITEIENRICFLTEGIPCISLTTLLDNGRGVAEIDAANIISQISLAVGYLHESHIVHRNLRPDIFSLDWRGRLKISDLSTCKKRGCRIDFNGFEPAYTFPYTAPEALLGRPYEPVSDWWSVGAILYKLITGETLFNLTIKCSPRGNHKHDVHDRLINGIGRRSTRDKCKELAQEMIKMTIEYPEKISLICIDLARHLLQKDPARRLRWTPEDGINDIKHHPFLSNINWDAMSADGKFGQISMDLSFCSWTAEQIKLEQQLGDEVGSVYGQFYLVSHVKTHEAGVMKVVFKPKMRQTGSGWRRVMNERLAWQRATDSSGNTSSPICPFILPLMGFFETEATYCFVAQYMPDATSLSVVAKSAPLSEDVIKILSAQLALAVNHLHVNGILHRNLTPNSIIVEKCGRLKLFDFHNAKCTQFSRTPLCHVECAAPELLDEGTDYGKEADWWSFGIILYQLLTGMTPFEWYCDNHALTSDHEIQEAKNDDLFLHKVFESIPRSALTVCSPSLSPAARKLLLELLTLNPERRLGEGSDTLEKIQQHPFYSGLNWKKLESLQ